jgi:hypothetical protein
LVANDISLRLVNGLIDELCDSNRPHRKEKHRVFKGPTLYSTGSLLMGYPVKVMRKNGIATFVRERCISKWEKDTHEREAFDCRKKKIHAQKQAEKRGKERKGFEDFLDEVRFGS